MFYTRIEFLPLNEGEIFYFIMLFFWCFSSEF
ncbi:MAG: hypothetical protein [Podoviridae sp. ctLUJ1]|nr:MAG: hypothetical protein [Podoviridae sp. ctLUJ1]